MTLVKTLRELRGRRPEELAGIAGINLPSYYDLEDRQSELEFAVAVGSVARIARELGVKPSALFGGTSTETISVHDLALRVRERVAGSGKSLAEFEDEIGWGIADALADPNEFREFNADGLRAACDAVNINWFDVLDHLDDPAPAV